MITPIRWFLTYRRERRLRNLKVSIAGLNRLRQQVNALAEYHGGTSIRDCDILRNTAKQLGEAEELLKLELGN